MRPFYESERDRINEQRIARRIEKAWRLDLHKMPVSYRLDFAAVRDGVIVGWIEVKRRRIRREWGSVMLAVSKWREGCILSSSTGGGWAFVVENSEDGKLWWCDCSDMMEEEESLRIEWGGRTKATRDAGDVEPVIHIPTRRFKQVDGFTDDDLVSAGFVV